MSWQKNSWSLLILLMLSCRALLPQTTRLFTKTLFVLGFAVRGNLDDEHGNPGEQQQMNPTPLLGDEQDQPEQDQT
jgi:hypothetical protein